MTRIFCICKQQNVTDILSRNSKSHRESICLKRAVYGRKISSSSIYRPVEHILKTEIISVRINRNCGLFALTTASCSFHGFAEFLVSLLLRIVVEGTSSLLSNTEE